MQVEGGVSPNQSEGLRDNHFHTTALCAPTQAALLSGRKHHMNNLGAITEGGTAFPGNTSQLANPFGFHSILFIRIKENSSSPEELQK